MSSFRIDRQYVTFAAVEIHTVAADGPPPQAERAAGAGSPCGDMEEYRRAILEKIQQEAEDKAKLILAGAEFKAELMLKKTRKTAAAIIREAQEKAGDVLDVAKREGYQQGQREAAVSAEKRKSEEAQQLLRMQDELQAKYAALVDNSRQDIIALVVEISKKIIGVKLMESDQVFTELVNGAMDKLKQAGYIMLHVCPEDYARYFGSETAENLLAGTDAKITVMEEEAYSRGDLVVESEGEVLDLSVFRQLKKVEEAFLNQ